MMHLHGGVKLGGALYHPAWREGYRPHSRTRYGKFGINKGFLYQKVFSRVINTTLLLIEDPLGDGYDSFLCSKFVPPRLIMVRTRAARGGVLYARSFGLSSFHFNVSGSCSNLYLLTPVFFALPTK